MNIQIFFVDCQKDFIEDGGALQVPGAPEILENLAKLRKAATDFGVTVVYTQDFHAMKDPEIRGKPDFKITFPPHCIAGTEGAHFVDAVACPDDAVIIEPSTDLLEILQSDKDDYFDVFNKDIIFTKQIFSTFDGNKNAETYINATEPDIVFVCGVAGDVCVRAVVDWFLSHSEVRVVVLADAIKSLDEKISNQYFTILTELGSGGFVLADTNFAIKFLQLAEDLGETL